MYELTLTTPNRTIPLVVATQEEFLTGEYFLSYEEVCELAGRQDLGRVHNENESAAVVDYLISNPLQLLPEHSQHEIMIPMNMSRTKTFYRDDRGELQPSYNLGGMFPSITPRSKWLWLWEDKRVKVS